MDRARGQKVKGQCHTVRKPSRCMVVSDYSGCPVTACCATCNGCRRGSVCRYDCQCFLVVNCTEKNRKERHVMLRSLSLLTGSDNIAVTRAIAERSTSGDAMQRSASRSFSVMVNSTFCRSCSRCHDDSFRSYSR